MADTATSSSLLWQIAFRDIVHSTFKNSTLFPFLRRIRMRSYLVFETLEVCEDTDRTEIRFTQNHAARLEIHNSFLIGTHLIGWT